MNVNWIVIFATIIAFHLMMLISFIYYFFIKKGLPFTINDFYKTNYEDKFNLKRRKVYELSCNNLTTKTIKIYNFSLNSKSIINLILFIKKAHFLKLKQKTTYLTTLMFCILVSIFIFYPQFVEINMLNLFVRKKVLTWRFNNDLIWDYEKEFEKVAFALAVVYAILPLAFSFFRSRVLYINIKKEILKTFENKQIIYPIWKINFAIFISIVIDFYLLFFVLIRECIFFIRDLFIRQEKIFISARDIKVEKQKKKDLLKKLNKKIKKKLKKTN